MAAGGSTPISAPAADPTEASTPAALPAGGGGVPPSTIPVAPAPVSATLTPSGSRWGLSRKHHSEASAYLRRIFESPHHACGKSKAAAPAAPIAASGAGPARVAAAPAASTALPVAAVPDGAASTATPTGVVTSQNPPSCGVARAKRRAESARQDFKRSVVARLAPPLCKHGMACVSGSSMNNGSGGVSNDDGTGDGDGNGTMSCAQERWRRKELNRTSAAGCRVYREVYVRELESVVREGEAERDRLVAALCELQHLFDARACGGSMVPTAVEGAGAAAPAVQAAGEVAPGVAGGGGAAGEGGAAAAAAAGDTLLDALPAPHHECACPWEAWAAAGAGFSASDEAVHGVLQGPGGVLPPLPPELSDVHDLLPGLGSGAGAGSVPNSLAEPASGSPSLL